MTRVVLLSGYPVKCIGVFGAVQALRIDQDELKMLVEAAKEVETYIGHPATARILSDILGVPIGVNRAEWRCDPDAVAVVSVLKRRCQQPDCSDVTPQDLEFYVVVPVSPCGTSTQSEEALRKMGYRTICYPA